MKDKLIISLECRFDYVEKCDILLASTYLDFRYKTFAFVKDEGHREEIMERVYAYLEALYKRLHNENPPVASYNNIHF